MIDDLAVRYWDYWKKTNALFNLQRGYLDYGDRMESISAEAIDQRRDELEAFAREADGLEAAGLDEQVTADVISQTARARAGWLGWREEVYFPNHTMGLHSILFNAMPRQAYQTHEHADRAIARYRAIGPMIEELIGRLQAAATRGVTPHEHTVARTMAALDAYLASPIDDDRMLSVAPPRDLTSEEANRWKIALTAAVTEVVRPALEAYRRALRDVTGPAARPDEEPGSFYLPGGVDHYEERIVAHTTLEGTPAAIHETGLRLVEELGNEYLDIGSRALGLTDLNDIYTRLREDPDLRYQEGRAIVADAEAAVDRAAAAMTPAFLRMPKAPCEVRETDVGAAAFYQVATLDGSRPGTFFINTSEPAAWGTFEVEALTFHEAIPGHHFERSLAQERSHVPEVRHGAPIPAFSEGWALYAERLCDELGLYSSELDRLGMLANDSLRATRLVADTGLHALGWSRRRAIDYMVDNSPITERRAAEEVDRYLGIPGQALSYMIGRLEIAELRADTMERLAGSFDLRGFHEQVLRFGSMPLPTLRRVVDAWPEAD